MSGVKKLLSTLNNVSTNIPIEQQFVHDLTYCIEKEDEAHTRKPSQAFKPSSIGGCKRNLYYQLTGAEVGEPSRSSYKSVGICENGTDRHIRLQNAIAHMKDFGIDCEYVDVADFVTSRQLNHIKIVDKSGIETKCFWEELPMSFMTDGIIKYKGKYYILEIKTMSSVKFFESKTVRHEHIMQGVCYSSAFHVDGVMYLYENRETLDKKAFLLEVTQDMKNDMFNIVKEVKEAVENKTPPEPANGRMACHYCLYNNLCKNNQ